MQVRLKSGDEIARELGFQENGKVQSFFTNTCYKHMDKYVPKDTGVLRENLTLTHNSITYEQPYASYQYGGVSKNGKPLNYSTPLTGSYWDERMVTAEKDDVIKEVANYARRLDK